MIFSSFTFIFLFLPIFLACYYISPKNFKNFTALLFSYLFYAWGAPTIILILIASSIADYYVSQKFSRANKKTWLIIGLVFNLALLFYFKYANFFIDQVNLVWSLFGMQPVSWVKIGLPAGISFFTFQKISYLVDVYVGRTNVSQKPTDYLLYVAFFPQLIAGPILRYHDVAEQIKERSHTAEKFAQGFQRFTIGLAKKVLVADAVGKVADQVFTQIATNPDFPASYAWIGIIAYTFQIYFDFSAYSDMAIGLGKMTGFDFLENFNKPYISQSITEFWRRWHISLSNWMKEYLYVPLGGNRLGVRRTYYNLIIVFLLSGLWHGANWTFVFWGLFHGIFLVIDRLGWAEVAKKLPRPINIALTFFVVVMGWVLFRAETLNEALNFYSILFSPTHWNKVPYFYSASIIDTREKVFMVVALFLTFLPAFTAINQRIDELWSKMPDTLRMLLGFLYTLVLFAFSVITISGTNFSPFLYFEF